jgi:hypothetical protein
MKTKRNNLLVFKVFFVAIMFYSIQALAFAQAQDKQEPAVLICKDVTTSPDEKIAEHNSEAENKNNQIKSVDSTLYTVFGDLLNDDPAYTHKTTLWKPIGMVVGQQAVLMSVNRYFFNAEYANIGLNSWKHNLETGFVWDRDRFAMNFLLHPYSGGLYFMSGRANGYNFWQSIPFAVGGSALWEYFGENSRPSYNDIINTPISGMFYGEILYRLSSNVLDDRTTGTERILRETGAAILSPTRFFARLISGDLNRITSKEIYQKEPLNIETSAGVRKVNTGSSFGTGPGNLLINTQFDYGYPFEERDWKPFDYFTVRAGVNFGTGRKILEGVTGYGILFGKTIQFDKASMLVGAFQHYNYFDNKTFELGVMSLSGGVMSKYPFSKASWLYTNFHLGVIPFAGNSTRLGPDTLQFRDYNYGGGMGAKLESGINLGWGAMEIIAYYFWIDTYVGKTGSNYIGIYRPRITIKLYKDMNVGFEELIYTTDKYMNSFGNLHAARTEQRVYLMYNLGNFNVR